MKLISLEFLLLSLFTFLLYRAFPKRTRWVILLISSAIFYCLSGLLSLILIILFTLSSYMLALILQGASRREGVFCEKENQGRGFFLCAFGCITLIVAFLLVRELSPIGALGISFYSLRIVSYLVDVYGGRVKAEKNLLKYALFSSFFPLAFLGPVTLYQQINETLYKGESVGFDDIMTALFRISYGVFKKLVIANALARPLIYMSEATDIYYGAYILFIIIFYTFQVFCDFSGGIDICIGLSGLFGVKLPENFNRPFLSTSAREFWNRWHITLGEWLEKYVFYPFSFSKAMQGFSKGCRKRLGVRMGKRLPLYAATMLTWLLTGLWHGFKGHFVAWGLLNGAIVLISRETKRKKERALGNALSRVRVFFIIGAVRILDLYKSFILSLKLFVGMLLHPFASHPSWEGIFEAIAPDILFIVICALLVTLVIGNAREFCEKKAKKPFVVILGTVLLMICTLVFGTYGQGFDASDFIYSHFNGG